MIKVYVVVIAFGLVLSARSVVKRDWEKLATWTVLMAGGLIGIGCCFMSWDAFVRWSQ